MGCDNVLESGLEPDRCGICNGDSSKCGLVSGIYSENCPGIGEWKEVCLLTTDTAKNVCYYLGLALLVLFCCCCYLSTIWRCLIMFVQMYVCMYVCMYICM